jgi:PAS domain S-box-containing protein
MKHVHRGRVVQETVCRWFSIVSPEYLREVRLRMTAHTGRYDTLFILSRDGIALCDMSGRFLDVNPAFCSMLGYSFTDLCSRSCADIMPSGRLDAEKRIVRDKVLTDGFARDFVTEYVRKDGTTLPVSVCLWLIEDTQGKPEGLWRISREISGRTSAGTEMVRAMNIELQQRAEERTSELEAINRELEAFSYSVSHDLRAPLRAVEGFSAILLERYADRLDTEGRECLRHVHGGALRMGRLIEDLLSLSRVTQSTMHDRVVDLSQAAEAVFEELRHRDPERIVRATVAPGMVAHGDENQLYIVLENLIGNAWKFTSRVAEARIHVGSELIGSKMVYYVRDNGAGFDMAYADKLFGAFQRLHSDAEFEGTGIGLATVQRIIHRHRGEVWADARENMGATFFFSLPIRS